MREIVEPAKDERGDEHHPAWALISASRLQGTPVTLFDSEVQHHHFVTVTIQTASRKRDLNHDHVYPDRQLLKVAMSEAQWASFVSSMGVGNGVPCTLEWIQGEGSMPEMPFAPRLQESMDEVRSAGDKALAQIRDAFEKVEEKPTKANIRHLRAMIENAPSNMEFAAKSLAEHAENVVQKARFDIEATARTAQYGLAPGDSGPAQLPEG